MYVCVCNAITDHQIRAEVQRGATSMRELQLGLGVASTCGRCAPCARELLMSCLHEVERKRAPRTHPGMPQLASAT